MIDIVERFLPAFVQRLYASGVERELLERSLNGMVAACSVLAVVALTVLAFRKSIGAILLCVDGRKMFMAVLVALSVLSLPDPVFPLRPGLDYSWQWMLNRLAFGVDWGASIVFTYGPLGWLLYPSGRWVTVLFALAVNVCFCILWIGSVRRIYLSSESGRAVAWGLVLTMLFPQMSMEWRWIALAVVLVRVSWLGAGIVSAMLSFMKFSSLLIAVGTQLFLLVADRKRRSVANWAVGFIVSFVLLASLLFSSPSAFWNWAVGSVQIAAGYNSHMLTEKGALALTLPFVAFLALVHRPRHFLQILPFAPLLYCSVKYSWVRQGMEPFLYVLTLVAAFMMGGIVAERRRIAITSVVFILVGYGLVWPRFFAAGQTYFAFPFGVNPVGVLRSVALPHAVEEAKSCAAGRLAASTLPDNFRKVIGDATIQLLPHEFAPAMADPTLRIAPYATMQMYSTYTAWLDSFAARSYSAAGAPEFIAVSLPDLAFDGKNAFLDSPRTWAAIRANYSLCDSAENGQRILLRRRASSRPVVCDRRIAVPDATLGERLVALFFRGRMHYAEIEVASGALQRFRVNPSVLKEPVDHDLPLAVDGLATYLSEQ